MYEIYAKIKLEILKIRITLDKDKYMNGLVLRARLYAYNVDTLVRHKYDGKHYSFHTNLVYYYTKKYKSLVRPEYREGVFAAAFTHDLIEDCGETFNDVKAETSDYVARLTSAMTTYVHGHSRNERAPESYYDRLKDVEYGDYLKICDRLANIKISTTKERRMAEMYAKEHKKFKERLFKSKYSMMFEEMEDMFMSKGIFTY